MKLKNLNHIQMVPYQKRTNLNFYSILAPENDIPRILKINESNNRFQLLNNKDSKKF